MIIRLLALIALIASAGASAFQYYEEPDPSPYLANIGAPPACDYIIDDNTKWANINSGSYRVFCVAPGDYTAAAIPVLTADGTAQAPRWIRYYNAAVADDVHPYFMATNDRAVIKYLDFNAADYWIIDRITVNSGSSRRAMMVTNSDNNVFSRLDLYAFQNGITFYAGASYNVVQYSTLHDNAAGYDAGAVENHSWNYADGQNPLPACQFNRVVSNEIWNVGDGFQNIGDLGSLETYNGTVVYNNDMYLTTARYTDCAGNLSPSGLCAKAENAVDIKSSSTSATDPVIIAHNRMWGFRESQSGTGMSDSGTALVAHLKNSNLRIEGNIIWNSATGITLGYDFTDVTVAGNLFHTMLAASNDGTWGTTTEGAVLSLSGTISNLDWDDNVFSQITGGSRRTISLSGAALTSAGFAYTDNILLDADASYPSTGSITGTTSGNEYYGSDVPAWDTPAVNEATVPEEWGNQFCTTIMRITNPTTQCFSNALYSTGAPVPITPPTQFRILD